MALTTRPLEIEARDGYRLGATLFVPDAPNGRAASVHAATGVPQQYYGRFAAYLAERGFTVLTFDYRGIGRSRPATLKGFAARMRDWAELDGAAALDFLEREAGGAKLVAVGHSFGGQAFGLLPILSAAENVEVPLRLQKTPIDQRRDRVAELLELVG